MDPIQVASLEAQLRSTALSQAAHDFRGDAATEKVVGRAEAYFAFLRGALPKPQLADEQIKHMVDRFLSWRLPENFNPDEGIHFDADAAKKLDPRNHRYEPYGTNLLDATQADAMVRYMVEGMPA